MPRDKLAHAFPDPGTEKRHSMYAGAYIIGQRMCAAPAPGLGFTRTLVHLRASATPMVYLLASKRAQVLSEWPDVYEVGNPNPTRTRRTGLAAIRGPQSILPTACSPLCETRDKGTLVPDTLSVSQQ